MIGDLDYDLRLRLAVFEHVERLRRAAAASPRNS